MQSNNPTPINPSSSTSGSATAVTIPPMQAASTRNPKVILVAGLGILALIMVAVFGIIAGIKKGPVENDLATGDDYLRDPSAAGSATTGIGSTSTTGLTSTLPGSGLVNEQPQPITANNWPAPAPGNPGFNSGTTPGALPGSATTSIANPWDNPQRTLMDPPAPTTTTSSTTTATRPGSTSSATTASTSTGAAATRTSSKRYTVKESDTLWKIAQAHLGNGAHWKRIVAANPGLTPERLRTGMTIRLPDDSNSTGSASAGNSHRSNTAVSTGSANTSTATRKSVTVKSGDTLYAIARREYGNGELWDLIYRANQSKIPNPHNLPTGLTLTLPAKPNR